MSSKPKSYQQLKNELDEIIGELEAETIDIEEGIELFKKGQKIVAELEKYLEDAKAKIDILKPGK